MSGVFQRIIHFKNSSRILINIELRFKKDDIKINSSFKSENFSVTGEKESNHLILLNYFDDFMLHCTVESIDLFINSTCLIFDGNNSCLDCNARSSIRGKLLDLFLKPKSFSPQQFPIKIICYLEFKNSTPSYSPESLTPNNLELEKLQKLSHDFSKILDRTIASDVTLDVSGVKIKSHRIILQARSPVFDRMFNHDTSESASNIIVIPDIRAEIMNDLLLYLYSGVTKTHDFDDACDLYYAADKYEVLSLRDACKMDLLMVHLKVDNVCQMLSLANRHGDESFKENILKFIKRNFKTMVKMESFEELSANEPKLAVLVMRYCMN
nr:speckle-type POZ protein-like isoform X1 [Parasteatoda tepidariorum]